MNLLSFGNLSVAAVLYLVFRKRGWIIFQLKASWLHWRANRLTSKFEKFMLRIADDCGVENAWVYDFYSLNKKVLGSNHGSSFHEIYDNAFEAYMTLLGIVNMSRAYTSYRNAHVNVHMYNRLYQQLVVERMDILRKL